MKPIKALISLLALGTSATQAQDLLTESDRRALSKKVEILLNQSNDTLTKRQAVAYNAYKSAVTSETAALELYLKCTELHNFEEEGKSGTDFREWKRKQKDKYSDPGFKTALRHQLNWLVLTIEASRVEDEDYSTLTPKALTSLKNIFNDAQKLKGHQKTLRQNAMSSIFAKAYNFQGLKAKNWPNSPLAIDSIYDKLVFPQLRAEQNSTALRAAWKQKIFYQEKSLVEWAKIPETTRIGLKKDQVAPEYTKFLIEKKPELVWEMEVDLFKAGDQSGAATRMLSIVSSNMSHNKAKKWAEELTDLVAPKETETEEIEETELETVAPPKPKPATSTYLQEKL